MFYEKELDFLIKIFKKARISINVTTPELTAYAEIICKAKENILYKMTDMFMCNYLYMLLPEHEDKTCLLIGPYKTEELATESIMEIAENLGFEASQVSKIEKYYLETPLLDEDSKIFSVVDAFCETIWEDGDYKYVNIDTADEISLPLTDIDTSVFDELNIAMEMDLMEKRYAFENQFMDAVSRGQLYKSEIFTKSFSTDSFEQRLPDTLRNSKNYMIIMNTLLRKAAERGGVHPYYLDKISSKFAKKIENFTNPKTQAVFMRSMFEEYCRLVNKHSTRKYSKLIKDVVIYVDANLSEDIKLAAVAKQNGVSASYLSTTFREETGKTFIDYVNGQKIDLAKHLLKTTSLQVQTIAHHCGFLDMQYFSKVFKKYTGYTPRGYREKKRTQNT